MAVRVDREPPLDEVVGILIAVQIQHEEGGNVPEGQLVLMDETKQLQSVI